MKRWYEWGGSSLACLALAIAVGCATTGWRDPEVVPRSDAALPNPALDPRLLGPWLDVTVEAMARRLGADPDSIE